MLSRVLHVSGGLLWCALTACTPSEHDSSFTPKTPWYITNTGGASDLTLSPNETLESFSEQSFLPRSLDRARNGPGALHAITTDKAGGRLLTEKEIRSAEEKARIVLDTQLLKR